MAKKLKSPIKRFPIKTVLILGLDNIKKKPVRFAITAILFTFTLFLMGAGYTATKISVTDAIWHGFQDTNEKDVVIRTELGAMTPQMADEIAQANQDFNFIRIYGEGVALPEMMTAERIEYIQYNASGYVSLQEDTLTRYGMKIMAGRLPQARGEVALPLTLFNRFQEQGYQQSNEPKLISNYDDILGCTVKVSPDLGSISYNCTVVGIVDTGLDYAKFASKILDNDNTKGLNAIQKSYVVLGYNTYHNALILSESLINEMFNHSCGYAIYPSPLAGYGSKAPANYVAINMQQAKQAGLQITYLQTAAAPLSANQAIMPKSKLITYLTELHLPTIYPPEYIQQIMYENSTSINISLTGKYLQNYNITSASRYNIVGFWDDTTDHNYTQYPYMIFGNAALAKIQHSPAPEYNIGYLLTQLSGNSKADKKLIGLHGSTLDDTVIEISTIFSSDIEIAHALSQDLGRIGYYIGIAFAVFSVLMMFNFISSGINAKRKEVAALYSMGANYTIILSIFLIEGILAAIAASILGIGALLIFAAKFTPMVAYNIIAVRLFTVTYKQALAIFGLGIAIAVVGSTLPIVNLLRKRPAEILRD